MIINLHYFNNIYQARKFTQSNVIEKHYIYNINISVGGARLCIHVTVSALENVKAALKMFQSEYYITGVDLLYIGNKGQVP